MKNVNSCIRNSFQKITPGADTAIMNPYLDDNRLLREEKLKFDSIAGYEHFPLLKINGLNYSGSLNVHDLMDFICSEILGDDNCHPWEIWGFGWHNIHFALVYFIFAAILSALAASLMHIRGNMKQRYEAELSLKIDASLAQYLDKA